jgi:lysyl-tRNA synthetase class I
MNPQILTATDPCPDCGGFNSTHWTDRAAGWIEWHCRCGHDWVIPVDESGKDIPWTRQQ